MRTRILIALTCGLALSIAGSPAGQTNPDQRPSGPLSFGTADEAITTISGLAFRPESSLTTYSGDALSGRWVTGGPNTLRTPVTEIPNGALLTQVTFYIEDSDAGTNFTGAFCRHWIDSATGANPGTDCPVIVQSTDTGQAFLIGNLNLLISYRFDVAGSPAPETVSYTLAGNWGTSTTPNIKLRLARLLWRRQVSPAPASATFADVPVGHPFRPFVEALAASGITGGCAPGLYCPDSPVTRGQMAVFLSAALGLHWPAF